MPGVSVKGLAAAWPQKKQETEENRVEETSNTNINKNASGKALFFQSAHGFCSATTLRRLKPLLRTARS
jgi:hypothetical protein